MKSSIQNRSYPDIITVGVAFVNIGLIVRCPTGLTKKDIIPRAPNILHIFFSMTLRRSSTIRISLSHPFFIEVVSLSSVLCRLSTFSNKTPSICSCLSNFSLCTARSAPSLQSFPAGFRPHALSVLVLLC